MANENATEQNAGERTAEGPRPKKAKAPKDAGAPPAEETPSKAEDGTRDAGNDAPQNGEAPPEERSAEDRLAEAEAERDEYKERMMRALAEAENVRRRAERDQRDARIYGGTRLARDLLSVYDNLSRALAAADDGLRENHTSFLEGVELTQRELTNAFAKHKIEEITPKPGDKFDPNRHQAMFEAPIPGAEAGTVVEAIQAGFAIADRLLRPALVGVAKPPQDAAGPEPAKPEAEAAEPQPAEESPQTEKSEGEAETAGNDPAKTDAPKTAARPNGAAEET